MKSVVAILFFSLLASAAQAAPAALAEAQQQTQVQKQERDNQVPQVQDQEQDQDQEAEAAVVIPLRLLDRDGNYVQLLEPRSAGDTHFTFPSSASSSDSDSDESSSYAMVCSRIPATHTQCVVRVWFDNHHPEEEGLVVNDSSSTSLYPDPSEIVFAPEDDEDDEPCVALGVDAGDGMGEQGLLVRKIDVHCPS
jgi:hypothetical protein